MSKPEVERRLKILEASERLNGDEVLASEEGGYMERRYCEAPAKDMQAYININIRTHVNECLCVVY